MFVHGQGKYRYVNVGRFVNLTVTTGCLFLVVFICFRRYNVNVNVGVNV